MQTPSSKISKNKGRCNYTSGGILAHPRASLCIPVHHYAYFFGRNLDRRVVNNPHNPPPARVGRDYVWPAPQHGGDKLVSPIITHRKTGSVLYIWVISNIFIPRAIDMVSSCNISAKLSEHLTSPSTRRECMRCGVISSIISSYTNINKGQRTSLFVYILA